MTVLELMRYLLITKECTQYELCKECPLYVNNKCALIKTIECLNDEELLSFLHTQTKY